MEIEVKNKLKKDKIKNHFIFVGILLGILFFPIISEGKEIFADYRVHFNKVYISNYVQTENDELKLKRVGDLTYEITNTGNFDNGGRQLNINLKNGIIDGQYNEYYSNGNIFTSGKYVNGKKEGLWKIYTENGLLWKSYEFKNDELNGEYISYFASAGTKEVVGHYKNNKLHGIWEEYYSSGNKKKSGKYENGAKTGIFTEWFLNGGKKSVMNFENDDLNGKMVVYYENGTPFYEADMVGRDGNVKGYNQNGTVSFEGRLEDNKRKGAWSFYDATGNIINKVEY